MTMRPTASNKSDEAKYRGVRKRKWGKWVSEIRLPNSRERIWLGSYDSPEKAARAFDAALYCLRGNTANFNFPDQPPEIPGGTDLHPSQIQAVAAHFANSYYAASSSASPSASTSSHVFQDPNVSQSTSTNMDFHISTHEPSFYMEEDNININSNMNTIPDYGIYPGFDDYFMQVEAPLAVDYGEDQAYDGVYSHDPCYLWNF